MASMAYLGTEPFSLRNLKGSLGLGSLSAVVTGYCSRVSRFLLTSISMLFSCRGKWHVHVPPGLAATGSLSLTGGSATVLRTSAAANSEWDSGRIVPFPFSLCISRDLKPT